MDGDEQYFEESGKQDAAQLLELVDTVDKIVLDLGCGIGRVAHFIAPRCGLLMAVDISERMLELAKERLSAFENVRYVRSLPSSMPRVDDNAVDFLYSLLVLQHLEREDAFSMLREIRRVVRPGGSAFLTFPNILYDVHLASFVNYVDTGETTNKARARFYTPSEVERLVKAAGFENIELIERSMIAAVCR